MSLRIAILALPIAGLLASAAPAGDATRGKTVYTENACYFCHGTAAQGGANGPRLAAIARTADAFLRYVRRPAGAMPAFSEKLLTDQDLIDVLAYLQSLPAAKPAHDIPLLAQLARKP
ncbi:MAG: cytochrome c [Vicinamibacterales bacterium]